MHEKNFLGLKNFGFGAGFSNYVHIPPDTLYRGGSTSQSWGGLKFVLLPHCCLRELGGKRPG